MKHALTFLGITRRVSVRAQYSQDVLLLSPLPLDLAKLPCYMANPNLRIARADALAKPRAFKTSHAAPSAHPPQRTHSTMKATPSSLPSSCKRSSSEQCSAFHADTPKPCPPCCTQRSRPGHRGVQLPKSTAASPPSKHCQRTSPRQHDDPHGALRWRSSWFRSPKGEYVCV